MSPLLPRSDGELNLAAPEIGRSRRFAANVLRLGSQADAFLILLAFAVVASLASPNFLTAANISNLLSQAALLGILAIAQFIVVISGGFDLSVAAVMALASVLLARFSVVGLPLAALMGLGAGLVCGLINGLAVTAGRVQPLIATLAMMGIARGLAFTASEQSILVKSPLLDQIRSWSGFLTVPTIVWFVVVIIAAWWCHGTRQARHTYAIGGNEITARLAGVAADRIKIGIYTTAGALAGLAGLILVIRSGSGVPSVGVGWELDSIAAIVIGGARLFGGEGSLLKAMAGVLIYQLIANIMNLVGVDPFYQGIVRALVIILAVGLSVLRQTHAERRQIQGRL
jgi:ribose/xylose/arabinose/galactoside ABC-type transport system permease subunit